MTRFLIAATLTAGLVATGYRLGHRAGHRQGIESAGYWLIANLPGFDGMEGVMPNA